MAEQKRILGKRILLIEDDPGARDSVKLLLTIDRHTVVEATESVEAIELLRSQPFDLAILDYFMPGMRGSQVALRFREIAPSVPILMVTAYLEKLGDADKPVDAVIGKPFAIEDLRSAIVKLLSSAAETPVQQKSRDFNPASLTHDNENKSFRRQQHTRRPLPCMSPVVGPVHWATL